VKKTLKLLLLVLVWLAIAAVLVGGALVLDLSVVLALQVLAGLIGIWLAFLLVRKLVRRYRAKKRAENLVNTESPQGAGDHSPSALARLLGVKSKGGLEWRYRRLRRLLENSRLREQGDPQYVLPWYLLLGHDGAGKSELIRRAGLASPTLDDEALRGDDDSLEWWLYNEGIILDAPGTYLGDDENSPPNAEWSSLLQILGRERPREPLNGIVVPISYEKLTGEPDSLYDYGRLLRKRVDELMRAVKVHLPIYIVVTKCDQVSGFTAWCQTLGDQALAQPMGCLHEDRGRDGAQNPAQSFVRRVAQLVSERVSRLMLVAANESRPDPELLRLPQSLEQLERPLAAFADGLFQATAFEEAPRLQGVYFTGRAQAGRASHQAFARDVFARVLPANRRVLSTLSDAQRAERRMRGLVLSGWGAAVAAILAVLIATWSADKEYLNDTAQRYAGQFGKGGAMSERIDRMHRLRVMTQRIASEVSSWWMPWFGVPGNQDPQFLHDLRRTFYSRSQREVIKPLDARLDQSLADAREQLREGELPNDRRAAIISTLVERINLLAAYADGVRGESLRQLPGPYYNNRLYFDEVVDPLTIERANEVYAQALLWSPDPAPYRERLSKRREQLVELLEKTGKRMSWLVPWANDRLQGNGFALSDFWAGSGDADGAPRVEPAFTTEGHEAIQRFLSELEQSGIDPDTMATLRKRFMEYYRDQYLAAWERFAKNFQRGEQRLRTRQEKLQTINALASTRNPHFALLDTMYENLEPFAQDELPAWAEMVRFYDAMRSFASDDEQRDTGRRNRILAKLGLKAVKKTGPVGKSLAKSGRKGLKTQKKLDRATASSGTSPSERELRLEEAGQILDSYRGKLEDISFSADVRSASHEAAKSLFTTPDNLEKGQGAFAQAHKKMRELQGVAGVVTQYNRAFWDVFMGPLDLVADFYVGEAACYLQEQWEKELLVQLDGVPDDRRPEYMFGEGGIVWQFVSQRLDPFIERRPRAGYVPTRAADWQLPLTEDFLSFVTSGREAKQRDADSVEVRIEAEPTHANAGAERKPGRTVLQLSCENGDEKLVNLNFPVSKIFNWSTRCSDTTLRIEIGSYVLEKKWEGDHGFAKFLSAFRSGRQRYRPKDFPRQRSALTEYEVRYIDIGFDMSGHQKVIERMKAMPTAPPDRIASCWA